LWALASALVVSLVACSGGSTTAKRTSPTFRIPAPNQKVAIETGYSETESFCAQTPLTGGVMYKVKSSEASLDLYLSGLPKEALVGLDWRNNDVRGYLIAAFFTDSHGHAIQSSLRFFRPGEVKGVGLVVTTESDGRPETVVGRLGPC
jgi:hypothetical protein